MNTLTPEKILNEFYPGLPKGIFFIQYLLFQFLIFIKPMFRSITYFMGFLAVKNQRLSKQLSVKRKLILYTWMICNFINKL